MCFSFPIIIWFLCRCPMITGYSHLSGPRCLPQKNKRSPWLDVTPREKIRGGPLILLMQPQRPFLKFLAHGGKMFLGSTIFSRGASILNNFERKNIFFSLSKGQCWRIFRWFWLHINCDLSVQGHKPTLIMVHMLYTLYTYIFLWMNMILKYQSIIVSRQNDPVNQKNCPTSKYIKGFKIVRYYKRAGGKILI